MMSRYFLEVAYKGTAYSGFQVQQNATTIQAEVENAFNTIQRLHTEDNKVKFTGSSRTDTGVHARQNYFHFDCEAELHPQLLYKMNALLPRDIVVRSLVLMPPEAHCRFDATSRAYQYHLHQVKDPFKQETSYYFPYTLDLQVMQQAASLLLEQTNYYAFSKTNTQVKSFQCHIMRSSWQQEGSSLVFSIEGNRFLRGMVRLLTASMLQLGRHKSTLEDFENLFKHQGKCGTSVPAQGLFLEAVNYPQNYFPAVDAAFTGF